MHVLSVIAVFAISAGILLVAQSGCIGATLAGTDGSYDTPDTGLSGHALVQAVTAGEGMTNLSAACQIADTFADMFFTGMLDVAYAVHAVLSLTAVGNITNDDTLELTGPRGITTFESDGHIYAAVASDLDSGVQILNVTNPSNITAAGSITDTPSLELAGAVGIATFESGSHTYAAVAAYGDDGVQILNVTNPSNITAAGHITDTPSLVLKGAIEITTFKSGVHTYAAVTAYTDNGVQILDITDPPNITAVGNITNTGSLKLTGPIGITTFESGGHTYAAVAAYSDHSVQILNVTDPSTITAAGSITNGGSLVLDGPFGITTFASGAHTYAAVAAFNSDTIQILNVTDPSNITAAGSIANTLSLELNDPQSITTFESGAHTYAAVAANEDNGVQILDVTDPSNIIPAGSITNDNDLELEGAVDVTTFESGAHTYVAVTAFNDNGVQIIRINIAGSDTTPPTITLEGSNYITITVGPSYTDDGATCDDDVDGPITPTQTSTVDINTVGTYTVTYSCTDAAGNDATQVSRTVTVIETGAPFITTWTATDSDKSITLPMKGMYSILWGDGSNSTNVSDSQSHTYGVAGNYTVTVLGDGLDRINLFGDDANALQLESIEQWGGTKWTTMENAFYGAANMVYRATDVPDLSGVTDMTYMFFNAASFDGDLSYWNVSGVTDMSGMFRDTTSFNGNLSAWDVSRVTDMDNVFHGATSFNGDLSSWNVSGVTDMDSMFFETRSFNGNLSAWDVSGVTGMFAMFHDAESFNGNLSAWDVSRVIDMTGMFHGATSFNGDISAWDVSMVTDMRTMFHEASRFNGNLSAWDVSRVTDMNTMFDSASRFNGNLSAWDVSGVTDMNAMFDSATSFNGNLSSWDVSKVTTMIYMFRGATSFNGDISSWDVSSVTVMNEMFNGASSFNQPLNDWNVSSVTFMANMFDNASDFDQNLGNWYVVPDSTSIAWTAVPGIVGSISAQNTPLNSHTPVYGIGMDMGGDSDLFGITDGNKLNMTSVVDARFDYTVNVTASDGTVFEDGNNWRVLEITVSGGTNGSLVVLAGDDQTVGEGDTVTLSGNTTDPNGDSMTYTWSQTDPAQPSITFVNASASSTTFVAPAVTGDTVFTIALTANDGTQSAEDTLEITVKETGTAFITTWAATDSDRNITLPMTGTYSVLWGDGSHADVSGSQSHTYGTAGNYTVTVLGDGLERIHLYGDTANARQLKSIDQWGDIEWATMNSAFRGASSMVYNATDAPDLSGVTDMSYMFYSASSFNGDLSGWNVSSVTDMNRMFFFTSSFNQTLNDWDVSSVTDMSSMFRSATSFNQPLDSWNVSSVTDMSSMFRFASSFNQTLNDWNVSSVTFMSDMFYSASSFNQALNSWNVSSVNDMTRMFNGADSFDQNLGTWYIVSATTDFDAGGNSLDVTTISAQNSHLGGHSLVYAMGSGGNSDLFDMRGSTLAFKAAPVKGSYQVNVTASGTDVFESGNNWRVLDITVPDSPPEVQAGDDQTVGEGDLVTLSGAATDHDGDPITYAWSQTVPASPRIAFVNAFAPSTTFVAPAVTEDTTFTLTLTADGAAQRVTDMLNITVKETSTAFITTWAATSSDKGITLPMKGMYSILWGDGSNSTNVRNSQSHTYSTAGTYTVTVLGEDLESINLFGDDANALQLESIEQWGGTKWTTMENAFYRAANMVYRATDAPDLSKVASMSGMFLSASSFDGDLSGWNVSNVTNMFGMFSSASRFNGNLSAWDVSGVTNMDVMFDRATSFNGNLSSWDVSKVTTMILMFRGATFNGDISSWDVSSVTSMAGMFNIAISFNQPLNDWNVSSVTDMSSMFFGASSFDQNLGNWYVVPDSVSIAWTDVPGIVGSISAQNTALDEHNPVYNVTGSDPTRFAIVNGNQLNMISVGTQSAYTVNVTASGDDVFENGNNWRVLEIRVTGQTTDTTPPTLSLTGSSSVTIEAGDSYSDDGAECTDTVDGTITPTKTFDDVDTSQVGSYTVTYSCVDVATNTVTVSRTVIVEDTTPPELTLTGSSSVTIEAGDSYSDDGAECTDTVDGTITPTKTFDDVDTSQVGSYTVTYSCVDVATNTVTVSRTVIVEDTTPPELTLTGSSSVTIEAGDSYSDDGAECTDTVDGTITPTKTFDDVDTSQVGSYTVTYSCVDVATNTVTVSRTVIVEDTTPPELTLTGSSSVTIEVGDSYSDDGAECTDTVDGTITPTKTFDDVDTSQVGSYTVTYSCVDVATNTVTVSRTVIVEDTTPPELTLTGSSSVTIEAGDSYSDDGAECTDTVDGTITPTKTFDDVDTSQVGSYTVTYSCVDAATNTVTVSRTVIVEDTTPPELTLTGSSSVTIEAGDSYSDDGAECTDTVDGTITPTKTFDDVDTSQVGSYTVTYSCVDVATNTVTVSRTVIVEDTTPPELTLTGSSSVTIEAGDSYSDDGAECTDTVDGTITPTKTFDDVDTSQVGSYTVTYSCVDVATNTVTVSRTVIVEDTTPPELTLTGSSSVTIEAGDSYSDDGAECTDTVDGTITPTKTFDDVDTSQVGSYTVTYSCVDVATNTVTVSRTVIVEDTTPPELTLTGSSSVTIEAGDSYSDDGAECTDTVDGTITPTKTFDDVDTSQVGSYTVTYSCVDAATNTVTVSRTVIVEDTTPPELTLTGSSSVTIEAGVSYSDDGAECTDTVDGTITPTKTFDDVDTSQVGSYTVTYSCADAATNTVTVSRTVIVEDTTPPELTLTGSSSVTIEVDDSYSDDGAECTDTVDGTITPTKTFDDVDTSQVGSYTVTYSCVDVATNTVTVSRTVNVETSVAPDNTPPELSLRGSSSVTIEAGDSYSDDGAECTDTVDGTITPTKTFDDVDTSQVGSYTVTYSCVDVATNTVTVSRTVIVEDTTPPELTLTGSSSVTIEVGDSYSDDGAECTDTVDGTITPTKTFDDVDTSQVGSYTVTYSCVDVATNTVTVSRTVIVEDTTPPELTLTGSSSVTIEAGDSYSDDGAECTDTVDGTITPTKTFDDVDTSQVGSYTVTYSCVDAATNTVTVSRTVIVEDTTPPELTLTGSSSVTIEAGVSYSDEGAECTDTVDGTITPTKTFDDVDTSQVGSYTVTYSCADAATNTVTVSRTVIVEDTTPPELTLTGSSSVTIEAGDSYSDDGAECTDTVDGTITPTKTFDDVDTSQVGSYTVTYSCVDVATNTVTVSRTVIVEDTTPPELTLTGSSSVTIEAGDSYSDDGAECTDTVDGTITPTKTFDDVDTSQVGSYTVTYSCADAATNTVTVSRTVNVETSVAPDNTPPELSLRGSSSVTIEAGDSYSDDGAECTDTVDGTITPTKTFDDVDTSQVGSYTVTYSCVDVATNTVTVSRTVIVEDTTPPELTLTGSSSVTIEAGDSYSDDGAECTDTVDGTITPTKTFDDVDTSQVGSYTVTYSCVDVATNTVTVSRTVIVEDTTPPELTLTGSSSVTIEVGDSYSDDGAECTDTVDGTITPTKTFDDVDTSQVGSYTVTYSCVDVATNTVTVSRTINVETSVAPDNTPPELSLRGSSSVTIEAGDSYSDDGAECTDTVDGTITPTKTFDDVDTSQVGSYTVTYSCADAATNTVTVSRTVIVEDTTPPELTLTGSSSVTIEVGDSYSDDGAECTDAVDGTITPTKTFDDVDTSQVGSYTVTYSCMDESGNTVTSVSRMVNVETSVAPDNTPPELTLTGSSSVTIEVGDSYSDDGAECTDAVDGTITPTKTFDDVDTSQVGFYTVTYSCADFATNQAVPVSRTVIVQTAVIPDTDRSSKSSRSSNTPNPLTTDNSIIIDGQSYDLGSGTATINPHGITTGQATDLVFTAYSPSDIVRFTIYLNLHGDDIKHSDSDTYIRYDHGVVEIVDPHGFISDASITITEDLEQSRKKIINTLVEFEGNMGLTNMAVYIWNEDRRYTSIRVFNALDITSGTEMLPDPEPLEPDSVLPADPEPVTPDFADDAADPEPVPADTLGPDDYDDAQVLHTIRMWSGFESEFITDTQLLELLGIEDYQGVDLPDWMMTELGVLVAKGDVTVGQFVLALQYVLENP